MSAYHSFNLDSSRASASLFPTRNILDRKVTELAPLECMEINSGIDNTGQEKNGSNSEHDGGGDDDDDDTKMKDTESEKKLQVGRKTEYKTLAGAIANRIRNKEPVTVAAVGPECVFTAARAIAVSSQYLEADNADDNDGDDSDNAKTGPNLVAVPKFNRVQIEGRDSETNVLEISVFVATTMDE